MRNCRMKKIKIICKDYKIMKIQIHIKSTTTKNKPKNIFNDNLKADRNLQKKKFLCDRDNKQFSIDNLSNTKTHEY